MYYELSDLKSILKSFLDFVETFPEQRRSYYANFGGNHQTEEYTVGLTIGSEFFPHIDVKGSEQLRSVLDKINTIIKQSEEDNRHMTKFYTLDELMPQLDASARAYAESVADTYIVGIEHKNELFPMHAIDNPAEADAVVAEINRTLDYKFPDIPVGYDDDEASLLEGFTFVPNKGMANIYVGKRNRLYLKGDILTQLGVKPRSRVLIAFNPAEKAFAIVKPNSPAVTADMRSAGYFVSAKKDVTAAKLFREFNLDQYEGETFYADTASLSGNVVIFRR